MPERDRMRECVHDSDVGRGECELSGRLGEIDDLGRKSTSLSSNQWIRPEWLLWHMC